MTAPPYYWLKKLEGALEETGKIPLWGTAPPFPWSHLSEQLSQVLQLSDLKIALKRTEWRSAETLLSGMGATPLQLCIELPPLLGKVHWILPMEEMRRLSSLALSPDLKSKGFSDQKLQEGFIRYLCLEAMHAMEQLHAFGDLSLVIAESSPLPKEGALCLDLSIQLAEESLWSRLICPMNFHHSFKTHFGNHPPSFLSSKLTREIELPLSLEAGSVTLTLQEWKKINVGDFLILDRATFDPKTQIGTLAITLNKTLLFQASLTAQQLKILDYVLYYEEDTPMNDHIPPNDNPEDEEFQQGPGEGEFLHEEDQIGKEIEEEILKEQSSHLWAPAGEEEKPMEQLLPAEEIPLVLTVEIARIHMNLEKLLQLELGNVIELAVKPEQAVDITLGGKKVARAELISLGDTLGLKILQIGAKSSSRS